MSKVYKMVTVVGTSTESCEKAIENGVAEASRTLRHLHWFEVVETRGRVVDGSVAEYQVKMELGFRVQDDE